MQQINTEIKPTLNDMRYYTYGDYFIKEDGTLKFEIVDYGNDDYTYLTLIHEMIECFLVRKKGITMEQIDEYDIAFENDIERVKKYLEPGADPTCPYKEEHEYADSVLKEICRKTGLDFEEYVTTDLDGKTEN